jgi:protein O-mannosyl-transferase
MNMKLHMATTASELKGFSLAPVPFAAPRQWLLCASIAVLGLVAVAGALPGPFLFDDVALIHGNHQVHDATHWSDWFTGSLWDTNYDPSIQSTSPIYWRPVVLASYALDWWLGHGSPLMFHVTNLLIHATNCALMFRLLQGWVGQRWAAWLGAALFAVHPVQTEPVAFIAGRADSTCLLGLLIVVAGIRARRVAPRRAMAAQIFGIGLALGSKEEAAVLPVLAFIEYWSEGGEALTVPRLRALFLSTLPYLAVSLLFATSYMLLLHRSAASVPPLFLRLELILEAVGRYTSLVWWPDDLTLGRALLRFDGSLLKSNVGYVALGGFSLVTLLSSAWALRLRLPAVTLGLLAYAAFLLPVSGIFWLGYDVLVSARFLYIPMVGLALTLAGALATVRRRHITAGTACALVLVGCGVRAFARSCDYESEQRFWRAEITRNPGYQAAQQYFIVRELREGRPRSALLLAHGWFQGQGLEVDRASLVIGSLEAILALTPDIDHRTLTAVQKFALAIAGGESASLELPALGLSLELGTDARSLNTLRSARRRLEVIAAEAASRTGDDALALSASEHATIGCEHCWTLLSSASIAAARAGAFSRAESLAFDAQRFGPPGNADEVFEALRVGRAWFERRASHRSPVNDAGFYAALGAHGRAYEAAAEAIHNPPNDPSSVRMLAEIAFRAGDVQAARRLLGGVMAPKTVQTTLEDLARKVVWRDRAIEPDTWVPEGTPG